MLLLLLFSYLNEQAYKKQTASSVRIARLIAITVVAVALILGTAIVLAAYLQMRHNGVALHSAAPVSSTETNVSPPFLFCSSFFFYPSIQTRACWMAKKSNERLHSFSPLPFVLDFLSFLRVIDYPPCVKVGSKSNTR